MTEQTPKSQKPSSPHKGHRERLRKRFLKSPIVVEDYELLELLLGYVLKRKDTKPQAKVLANKFGSIRAVLDAPLGLLRKESGIGESVETFFIALREVFARYMEAPFVNREHLCSPEAVALMAKARLADLVHEEIWVALLDNQNHLLLWKQLIKGSVSSAAFYPRDVFALALEYKASGIILAHNHPGGNPEPSTLDENITKQMYETAYAMDIRLIDHVIVTSGCCYSIRQKKLLHFDKNH